jgi:hypothetical protein
MFVTLYIVECDPLFYTRSLGEHFEITLTKRTVVVLKMRTFTEEMLGSNIISDTPNHV